ncbi:hypothetical protein C8R44DRAFT_894778 [Mycena epipterygia]|nr:hypothetical protein C8R44DRAFT_894778 [Mycena epipterygia]
MSCIRNHFSFSTIGFVYEIGYNIKLKNPMGIPEGYLFLCPLQDLQLDGTLFVKPQLPAYWSLDPSGVEKLTDEEAERLGFPPLRLNMFAWVLQWKDFIYTGLRKFHEAKGFDPDSQDVAIHLGYPLYRLEPGSVIPLCTHMSKKRRRTVILTLVVPLRILKALNYATDY